MAVEIEHSGRKFVSHQRGPNGRPVWPIDEYLVRSKHTRSVAERIRRLNHGGKEEGEMPHGIYFKRPSKRRLKKRVTFNVD